ncbi:MAG: MerR family transcriptional regulator [Clostridia bacterium]|nr:MerR family transcriptional regulator [Clostridia bacterium]
MKYLKTSDIAKAAGAHPNTVRLYIEWGFLPPVPRDKNGYRMFTEEHLDQMCLARSAFRCQFCVADIRKSITGIVTTSAQGDLEEALKRAHHHLELVRRELQQAEEALVVLEHWIKGTALEEADKVLKRNEAAAVVGISVDVLRNWERNGLIEVPRNPVNGYRMYTQNIINRMKVVRTLRGANYSMMAILRMMTYIDSGKKENLRKVVDTPGPDEDIVYATDKWISSLLETEKQAEELIEMLEKMIAKRKKK